MVWLMLTLIMQNLNLPMRVDIQTSTQESTNDRKSQDVSKVSLPLHTKHCPVHTVVELPFCQVTENANDDPGLL